VITLLFQAIGRVIAWPAWVHLSIAAVLLFGGMQWKHAREVGRLKKDIATLTETLNQERLVHADTLVALQSERSNVTTLHARVREQNSAILLIQAKAKQSESAAAARAIEALRAGEAAAAAIRSGHTHLEPGHDAVNEWLKARVGQ
jgi:hypothetical protein